MASGETRDPEPGAGIRTKHKHRDRLIRLAAQQPAWVLGYLDECGGSRLQPPAMHAWTAGEPLRLQQLSAPKPAPGPKALACYGLLRGDTQAIWLRFVAGRPVSHVTTAYLAWGCERWADEGTRALLLIWDNASWHIARAVRPGRKAHHRQAKREGGVRAVACRLPVTSPWLNPIEPQWVHGTRAVAEPARLLPAQELVMRVYTYYGSEPWPPLAQDVP